MAHLHRTRSLALAITIVSACGEPTAQPGEESTQTSTTTDASESGFETETGDPPPATGALELEEILDINAIVTTKGMDVDDAGRVFLWNYNQDQLEVYDGTLTVLADMGLITGFGTDLSVDASGDVVVSKGGDVTGEQLMKWDGQTGAPLWGPAGLSFPGSLLLGLSHASVAGIEVLHVTDGAATGGMVHRLAADDGSVLESIPVDGVPLDLAVADDGRMYVLRSTSSNPVIDGVPVELVLLDASGALLAGPIVLEDAVYLTLGSDGVIYVSSTDFDQPTRRIISFGPELELLVITELPPVYEGFAGGIASTGSGVDLRVWISAQGGVGSGEICDVLVYRPAG